MLDALTTVRRVMAEHQLTRPEAGLGGAMNELEALFTLQRAHYSWAQSSVGELPSKQRQLVEAIGRVDIGIRVHFEFEEQCLPPVLGHVLTKALVFTHRKIAREIVSVRGDVAATRLEGLTQEELLLQKARLARVTGGACQVIERHAAEEAVILKLAEQALQADAQRLQPVQA